MGGLAACLVATAAWAHIGYGPITTGDATVLRRGVTEVTLGASYTRQIEFLRRPFDHARIPGEVRYGWRDHIEIGFAGSYDILRGPDEVAGRAGFGDPFFLLKYLLTPVTPRQTGLGIEAEFGLSIDDAVGSGGSQFGITAVASTPVWSGLGHVEIGYRVRPGLDLFRWGLAYDRPLEILGPRTRLVGEVYGGRGEVPRLRNERIAQVGLKWRFTDDWEWRIAGGAGIGGGAPAWLVRVGTAKEFGAAAGSGAAGPGEYAGPPPWAPLQKLHEGTQALRDGDPARAVILLHESLEGDSTLVEAWNNLGVALGNLGRPTEARRAFEAALERGGEDADILVNLGYALYQAGDYAGARLALARAAALDPARTDVRAAVGALAPTALAPTVPR